MKKIMILYKDGTVKSKSEEKLTKDDVSKAEYFMINSTSFDKESRNYVMVEPSKLMLFDKAVIEYQLCLKYQDYDYSMEIEEFKPVKFETTSLTDVISMINSSDKMNILNNLLIEDFSETAGQLGITFMQIVLYKNKNIIYNKSYQLKGIDSILFDSYQVVKKFSELYDGNLCGYMIKHKLYPVFKDDDGVIRWKFFSSPPSSGMFGYPNIVSNSINILYAYEYTRLKKYKSSIVNYTVIYEKNRVIDDISNNIYKGNYEFAIDGINNSEDMYMNVLRSLHSSHKDFGLLVGIICNLDFIISSTMMMYSELYDESYLNPDDQDDFHKLRRFGCILKIEFHVLDYVVDSCKDNYKYIVIDGDTILTPTQIFDII